MPTTLIIPGLKSSGPSHWQTWLETRVPGPIRVTQNDWTRGSLPDWSSRVRREIVRAPGSVTIVAHSFGALAAAQAASDHAARIAGALLVAPADPEIFGVDDLLPDKALEFPTIVVASTNDPWMPFDKAERLAERWGAELVNLGQAGHINSETGYGPWPQSIDLLQQLGATARHHTSLDRLTSLGRAPSPLLPARRRGAFARFGKRAQPRDLHNAAALLRSAGWLVSEPESRSADAR